jgi:hypothetical protein
MLEGNGRRLFLLVGGRIMITNSGKDASVICENLNTVLREFDIPNLKELRREKKGRGPWKDELTTMEAKTRSPG